MEHKQKMDKKLLKKINEIIKSYEKDTIEIVDGLDYNQKRILDKVEYYWNSRYLNNQRDDLGRVKPFYNISKFRTNVATRATDLDVKDIKVESDKPNNRVKSMLLNHEIYKWMKETNLSKTLNEFGATRAKYGGALLKKSKKDGKLKLDVVEWKNVITDQVNIMDGVIIEKHYMSPIELSKKMDVWENVKDAIELAEKKDKNSKRTEEKVPVFEVHGEFEEEYLPKEVLEKLGIEEPKDDVYHQMMFIIAGEEGSKQVILYSEKEDELPYKYLAWDNVSGRALGIGIVEDGFEAQMWTNDAIIAEKNVMDLAGKVFIKTTSKTLGNNAISDMPNGMVIELNEGEDASLLNLLPSSIPQFQNLVDKWNQQYERATNTFEAVTGETLPANTPLGSVAIQSSQASSFFDYRREEAGIFWTEVFTEWVLPYIVKQINKEHILASDFSAEELAYIDENFATYQANQVAKDAILSGRIITQEDLDQFIEFQLQFLQKDGKRRYIDIPKDYFKDFESKITIDPTGEKKNKQTALQSLDNIFVKIASNPTILQNPDLVKTLNQMLEMSGLNYIFFKPIAPMPVESKSVPQTRQGEGAVQRQTESVLPEAQI